MNAPRFTLGLDLGTTHTALAFTRLDERRPDEVEVYGFSIPQLVAPGELEERPLLASALYLPLPDERAAGLLALPWDASPEVVVGRYAEVSGALAPTRLVASAKSWLSHPEQDPRARFLPLEAGDGEPKRSPLEAATAVLAHVRDAWNEAFPAAPFEAQELTITVPASFDPAARELTAEAARAVGARDFALLEEPQAALYAYLVDQGPRFREQLAAGDVLLIVDVGGGTTDFSLVVLEDHDGVLVPARIAVGDHILLGGDNVDLALAAQVEAGLGQPLDAAQRRSLVLGCRRAKEALLDGPDGSAELAIAGRSARLVGSTLRARLEADAVRATVLDGFFPEVPLDARPLRRPRLGLRTLGLPYADDAAITRHLAAFLARHRDARPGARRMLLPTAVLFNGGVFQSATLRARVEAQLAAWAAAEGVPAPRTLPGALLDQAVARGAAYHAFVRRHGGVRIRGGLAKSFYVGLESSRPAIPGVPPELAALCVAAQGLEEGSPPSPVPMELGLVVGEPVRFRFFAASARRQDTVGTLLEPVPDELVDLGEIESTLPAEGRREGDVVAVRLEASVDELGTLELFARPRSGESRWRVALDVRSHAR